MGKKKSVPEKKKKIAVIYARYSSHNQKEESIEQQVEACTKFALANNLEVIDVYSDKAITGKRETRAAYQRMIRDAEKGRFQVIIAYKSNRIARNMLNALQFEAKMDDFDISIMYAQEEFGDNAAGRFALRMMMNVNQFYSENMAEDIMRGMRDNALQCKVNNGISPLGYGKGTDGKYVIIPEEAEVVKEIYIKVLDGVPFVDIANELNARGIKTRKGARWNKNSFAAMLTNEKYTGVYSWSDIRIEGGMPQIIEKEMFNKVQEKLKLKQHHGKHREGGDYLLTGKLFCGKCKEIMVGMSGTSRNGEKHYYYDCRGKRVEHKCDKKAVRREWIEAEVASIVKDYVLRDETIEWIIDCCMDFQKNTFENQQLIASRKRLTQIRAELKNIVDAIAQGIYTDTTKDRLLELEAEKKSMEVSIEELTYSLKPLSREQIECYIDTFKNGDVNDKVFQKKLFNLFVSSVYLYDDGELRISFSGSKSNEPVPFSVVDKAEEQASNSVRLEAAKVHHSNIIRTRYR